jgi:hypothetical protein
MYLGAAPGTAVSSGLHGAASHLTLFGSAAIGITIIHHIPRMITDPDSCGGELFMVRGGYDS